MLSENLQKLRKAKGLSQEELAERIHVVRQTVSKWEKGLSVPDADLLIRLADTLDTSVSTLLGDTVAPEETPEVQQLSEKLARLNEELAQQKKRSRRWQLLLFSLVATAAVGILLFDLSQALHLRSAMEVIGGVDGPTAIFVTAVPSQGIRDVLAILVLILAVAGICKNAKR